MAAHLARLGLAFTIGTACAEASAVEWGAIEAGSGAPPWSEADDRAGNAAAVGTVGPVQYEPPAACAGSLRFARGAGSEVHAVWWQPRADSTSALRAARSYDDGVTWNAPVPVDTVDRSPLGCLRPAPAITVDPTLGYVHIVYYLVGPEGAGLFFAHSMERGVLYHEPVAIMYGERPSAAAVAAHNGAVAVAFEEPNAARPEVWFTLSTTAGHIFGPRARLSGTSVAAARPRIALTDSAVIVQWEESPVRGGAGPGTLPARVVTRTGRLPRDASSTRAPR